MKLWPMVLLLILLASPIYASGPTLPKQYRVPTEDELSSEWRKDAPDRYASVAADFNGDGLVDGAFLAVDEKHKKLVLMVVLFKKDSSEIWLKLQTMDYAALKYQGITLVKPSTISAYKGEATENTKHPITLKFNSIKSFSSEGPSSVFFWDQSRHQFKHLWLTK
jgi:hypothetical protein